MPSAKDLIYWQWIAAEAAAIHSDGCTAVTEWHQPCCFEHDLACVYAKDPRDAYRLHMAGGENVWVYAADMSRRQADAMFYACNRERSGPIGDARSFFRWIGVRLGAWF